MNYSRMELGDLQKALGTDLEEGPVSYTHLDVYKRQALHRLKL